MRYVPLLALVVIAAPLIPLRRSLTALTFLAMLYSGSLASLTQFPAFGYADEICVAALVVITLLNRIFNQQKLHVIPGLGFIIAFVLIAALGGLVSDTSYTTILGATAIYLKPWLFALALANQRWTSRRISSALKGCSILLLINVVAIAINYLFPREWAALWNGGSYTSGRFGLEFTLSGLFGSQLIAGNVFSAMMIVIICYGMTFHWSNKLKILALVTAPAILSSGRRTAVLGVLTATIFTAYRARNTPVIAQALILIPVGALLTWETISRALDDAIKVYVTDGATTARSRMYADMFSVANEHFPLGAGSGRFGSYFAGQDYSPEYVARGYQHIWGLSKLTGNDTFLTDTQWPAVIGEGGYLGLGVVLIALFQVTSTVNAVTLSTDPLNRFLALATYGNLLLLLIASVGLPVILGGSPPQTIFFCLLGVLTSYNREFKETTPFHLESRLSEKRIK